MAKSGSFSTNILSGHYTLRVDWSASQSVANNTSTITAKVYLVNDWALDIRSRSNNTITINGVTANFSSPAINTTGTHLLTTYTTSAIAHNDDGSKSVSMSCTFRFNATINGTYYGNMTASASNVALDTIARASQPSCVTYPEHTQNVGNFGDAISIHMNRKSSSFTHTVRYAYGSSSGTIATSVTTGTTWTIPLTFMNQIPSATKGSGTIYVDTYNGSTLVGTKSCGFTATVPSSVKPTCTCTLDDVTGVDTYYGSPVQGLSQIKATISATLAYSSPIETYAIEIEGARHSTQSATSAVLKNSGTSTVKASVVDERGRTGTWSYNMTVKAYARPSISLLAVHRCDADGTVNDQGKNVQVTFSATVTNLVNASDSTKKNTGTYKIRYKKSSTTTWTEITVTPSNQYSVSNYTYIFAADESRSYDVEVSVADRHATTTRATSASTAFSLIDFHTSGTGIRFGGVAEEANTFRSDLILKQTANHFCFSSAGVAGSGGYVLMARLTHTNENADSPITFVFTRRLEAAPMRVYVQFKSDSTTVDPDLVNITYEGSNYGAFLVKSATSIWDLYVEKVSNYDTVTLQDWYTSVPTASRLKITFPGTLVATVPAGLKGYYRATPLIVRSILDFIFPVGFVLTLYSHADPNTMYPGTTWERIENRFLWATTSGGTIGQTGGSSTHTLTVDEMPSHSHSINSNVSWDATNGTYANFRTGSNTNNYGKNNLNTVAVGGGKAHNNMPPYIQVSIWRRTE